VTESPWLTTNEAAEYLRYQGKHRVRSVYRFLERNGVPIFRRGTRSLLVARADLDRALGVGPGHRLTKRSA
jgi:Helix-turn-helix domain